MYWREITTRFAGGRSTPAMRAMLVLVPRSLAGPLALPLLVTRVRRADHPDDPLSADHLALVANLLHRRADLHDDTDSWSSGPACRPLLKKLVPLLGDYFARYVMRPRVRSYGDSSSFTLSPGRIRMKCIRIFPEMCASTLWPPLSRTTRNMALGSGSMTVPSTSMASSFGTAATLSDLRNLGRLPPSTNRPSCTGKRAAIPAG